MDGLMRGGEFIDELILFFAELSVNDTVWYNTLMASVNQEQYTSIQEILKLADLKRTLKASEKIEKQGGERVVVGGIL